MSASLGLTLRRPMGGKSQKITYTGTAGTSNALPPSASSVALFITTVGYVNISFGTAAVAATTSDIPLPANTMVILPIERPTAPATDNQCFVSAVQDAAGGTLYLIPLAD